MALNIRNPRAEQLAREIAAICGENLTEATIRALDCTRNNVARSDPTKVLVVPLTDSSIRSPIGHLLSANFKISNHC